MAHDRAASARKSVPDGLQRPVDAAWHALTSADCLDRLQTTLDGLSEIEARRRATSFGANALPCAKRPGPVLLFIRQFKSPLIYLLLGAALIAALIGHHSDALFILGVLVANAMIGAVQEGRAGASAEALRAIIRQMAKLRRAGRLTECDAATLVPGDIVALESGDRVPADVRLVRTLHLHADESLLTGEALPVDKDGSVLLDQATPPSERRNMVHAGTAITSGRGTGVVVATGSRTQLGRIDLSLREIDAEPLPLMRNLAQLSRQIAGGTVLLIAILAILLGVRGSGIEDILMLGIALAVAVIPEGLPIAATMALAAATRRMAARNVIVRTLPAVEGLGACTLIATDKTGTLTRNQLSVEMVIAADGTELGGETWAMTQWRPALASLSRAARLCNEATVGDGGEALGDSVDVALLRFADSLDSTPDKQGERLALFAYEPVNRFSSVAVRDGGDVLVIAKGAVETIAAMTAGSNAAMLEASERAALQGYRVLAFAQGRQPTLQQVDLEQPSGLDMIGCVALLDPLRPEATGAIDRCRAAGIDVRMLTGDHPATAGTIARQLGLTSGGDAAATGAQLAALANDPAALDEVVAHTRVFARIEPAQKLQIVQLLQKAGQTIAVTGDGVNDAPALQTADIGVAMGRGGTDVARGAADLILTDDNFASIVAGIEEGRTAYANLRRIVIFLVGTGMAEIGLFFATIVTGLPAPLTPVQILWANVITESAQTVGLALAKSEGDELDQPPRPRDAPIIDRKALMLMAIPALAMMVMSSALFRWWLVNSDVAEARSLALLSVVFFQNVLVLAVSSERRSILRFDLHRNRWLVLGVIGTLALQAIAFGFQPLRAVLVLPLPKPLALAACLVATAAVVVIVEMTKLGQRRLGRHDRRPSPMGDR